MIIVKRNWYKISRTFSSQGQAALLAHLEFRRIVLPVLPVLRRPPLQLHIVSMNRLVLAGLLALAGSRPKPASSRIVRRSVLLEQPASFDVGPCGPGAKSQPD